MIDGFPVSDKDRKRNCIQYRRSSRVVGLLEEPAHRLDAVGAATGNLVLCSPQGASSGSPNPQSSPAFGIFPPVRSIRTLLFRRNERHIGRDVVGFEL